jgi:hypothetical protein
MFPTCWAEATPEALGKQLDACEIWDARPQTKGTPCEATLDGIKGGPPNEGLGECDINMQNGNACFGSVGETCAEYKDCAQVTHTSFKNPDDIDWDPLEDASFEGLMSPWGTDETPMRPVKLTCGRDLEAQEGVLRSPEDTKRTAVEDTRCAFGGFNAACSLDPESLVDCDDPLLKQWIESIGFNPDKKSSGMCIKNCDALAACRCIPRKWPF